MIPSVIHSVEQIFLTVIHQVYDTIGWGGVVFPDGGGECGHTVPQRADHASGRLAAGCWRGGGGWGMLVVAGLCGAVGNLLGSWVAYWLSLKGGTPSFVEIW